MYGMRSKKEALFLAFVATGESFRRHRGAALMEKSKSPRSYCRFLSYYERGLSQRTSRNAHETHDREQRKAAVGKPAYPRLCRSLHTLLIVIVREETTSWIMISPPFCYCHCVEPTMWASYCTVA